MQIVYSIQLQSAQLAGDSGCVKALESIFIKHASWCYSLVFYLPSLNTVQRIAEGSFLFPEGIPNDDGSIKELRFQL